MGRFVYNLAIYFYALLIRIATAFNKKAKEFIIGRKNQFKNLQDKITDGKERIWVHCSSLGEFEQGRPLIEKIKSEYPEKSIILTFFSPSGYKIRKNYEFAELVEYMPLDTKKNARKFIEIVKPEAAIFIKYENWFNHLNELNKNNIPVFLVSAAFNDNQIFFKWYGGFFRKILKIYDTIFVQDKYSGQLLESISLNNYQISGDTRFDRVWKITQEDYQNDKLYKFKNKSEKLIVAGSTWPKDEQMLLSLKAEKNNIKMLIAPHETNSERINSLKEKFDSHKAILFSNIDKEDTSQAEIIIIDTIGLLSRIYKYGDIAYIGGGFGKGIHNILEAACYELPIIFGPNYQRFKEAKALIKQGGAFSINNFESFLAKVEDLEDIKKYKAASKTSINYVKKNIGVTSNIFENLKKNDVF